MPWRLTAGGMAGRTLRPPGGSVGAALWSLQGLGPCLPGSVSDGRVF